MQGKSKKVVKKLAATPRYVSSAQLTLKGFEMPFERELNKENRWVKLAQSIPWDKIVPVYNKLFGSSEGRPPISGRVIIGAMIIKHIETLSDRDTVQHITENVYMQYFLGYSSFTDEAPFTAPLFVAIRKRMTLELTGKISEIIATHCDDNNDASHNEPGNNTQPGREDNNAACGGDARVAEDDQPINKGKLLMDATVAPQDITYPTDLKLLDAARTKSEQLIDLL